MDDELIIIIEIITKIESYLKNLELYLDSNRLISDVNYRLDILKIIKKLNVLERFNKCELTNDILPKKILSAELRSEILSINNKYEHMDTTNSTHEFNTKKYKKIDEQEL